VEAKNVRTNSLLQMRQDHADVIPSGGQRDPFAQAAGKGIE
jgi:hypothetical protein